MPRKKGQPSKSPVILNKPAILERIVQGDRISDIAKSMGYKDHTAISQRLAGDPDYEAAKTAGIENKFDRLETELECANDPVTVARTRELIAFAKYRAGIINDRYAAKPSTVVQVAQISASEHMASDAADLLRVIHSQKAPDLPK